MSFARSTGRLLTTTACGRRITPHQFSSLSIIRPGSLRSQPPSLPGVQRRHLHWTAAIEGTVQFAHDSLITLNTTIGLPWYLTIPVAALGVSLFIRLPLQLYARRTTLKQSSLLPFLQAWRWRHAAMHDESTSMKQFHKSSKRIFRERGCQSWKLWAPFLGLPAWLIVPEALRRMSGMPGGIISWVTGGAERAQAEGIPPGFVPDTPGLLDTSATTLQTGDSIVQSLATGGTLWFPDLTAADPWMLLPAALCGLMVYNILPQTAAQRRILFNLSRDSAEVAAQTPAGLRRLRFSRFLLATAFGFMFITQYLPTAMLLYWVSSSAWTSLTYLVLDAVMPIKNNHLPVCKGKEEPHHRFIRGGLGK